MNVPSIAPLYPVVDAKTLLDKPRDLPEPWTEARWTSTARTGIAVALQDCGMDNGEVVWVPSYFTPAMTAPIEHVRCKVKFYPVTENLEIDVSVLRRQFELDVRGIVVPHFFGFPQQSFGELRKFCSERSIFILEDCAHGLLGKLDGRRFGEHGDYAIASLSKTFGVLEGGLVASHHGRVDMTTYAPSVKREASSWSDIAAESARWRRQPVSPPLLAKIGGARASNDSTWPTLEEISQRERAWATQEFTDVLMTQGATKAARDLSLRQDLNFIAQRRRENFEYFLDSARGWKQSRPLFNELPDGVVPYMFPLELKMPSQQVPALIAKGVPFSRWQYEHPAFTTAICPVAARYASSLIQLPIHQSITDEESEKISHALFDVLR